MCLLNQAVRFTCVLPMIVSIFPVAPSIDFVLRIFVICHLPMTPEVFIQTDSYHLAPSCFAMSSNSPIPETHIEAPMTSTSARQPRLDITVVANIRALIPDIEEDEQHLYDEYVRTCPSSILILAFLYKRTMWTVPRRLSRILSGIHLEKRSLRTTST